MSQVASLRRARERMELETPEQTEARRARARANYWKNKAKEDYRQAVLKMLRCVSPVATNAQFHDAVNEVIKTRMNLTRLNIELSEVKI